LFVVFNLTAWITATHILQGLVVYLTAWITATHILQGLVFYLTAWITATHILQGLVVFYLTAWITATHIFQGLACVMACISMVALILYTCVTETMKSFNISMFAVVSSFLTGNVDISSFSKESYYLTELK
jgi:hypothetical protein